MPPSPFDLDDDTDPQPAAEQDAGLLAAAEAAVDAEPLGDWWPGGPAERAAAVEAAVLEAEGASYPAARRALRAERTADGQPQPKRLLPFLRGNDIANIPDPRWLIQDLLPEGAFGVLQGAPGLGKTFIGLAWALCVATGVPFHGKRIIGGAGPVMYCLGEGHGGVKMRIQAWLTAHPEADRELFHQNFILVRKAVSLLDEQDQEALVNTTDLFPGLRLFVVDTWARAMLGGEENSAHDAGVAIGVCEEVRDRCNSTVLVVHHVNAAGGARGSTALIGAVDVSVLLSAGDDCRMVLSCFKIKDSAPFAPMKFNLLPVAHSVVLNLTAGDPNYQKPEAPPVRAPGAFAGRYGTGTAAF